MHILWMIVIGFLVGVFAKMLMPGRDPGGMLLTTLLGIAGAFVASWLGHALGWYAPDQPAGFIAAILGAILILMLYRLLRRPRLVLLV